MLSVQAPGYEFELEMLLAARHLGVDFVEEPIRTIYRPGNPTSHFQPFRDSMRIYFVLLRFSLMSVATALVDNGAFFIFFRLLGRLTPALLLARALAIAFNYATVRRAVFHSDEQHQRALPRYLGLAAANLVLSWALISFLTDVRGLPVIPSKIGVEACLFIANFAVQRDFVFARRAGRETV
jgi:putative flippase GtrA